MSGNVVKAILSFASGVSATNTLVLMATVSFPVMTTIPTLELITANVVALSVSSGTIFQSATGIQIVAGTGYVSLNGGSTVQVRRLLSSDSVSEISGRHILQSGPLLEISPLSNINHQFHGYLINQYSYF